MPLLYSIEKFNFNGFYMIAPKINLTLQQKTAPKVLMRQLVTLLPMNEAQLMDAIKAEVNENPFLVCDTIHIPTGSVDIDQTHIAHTYDSLYQILMPQIDAMFPNATEHKTAMDILAILDDDGFLRENITPIGSKYKSVDIYDILHRLQHCTPVGVFSRNMQEFYATYLRSEGKLTGIWKTVIDNLEQISYGDTTRVIDDLGADGENILHQLLQDLRHFPRSPDIDFATTQIVSPDLQAEKIHGVWHVKIISKLHHMLHINDSYVAEVRKHTLNPKDKAFITTKFSSAKWLKSALEMRAKTLQNIGVVLVQYQGDYLDGGDLKPLTLKQVATLANVHISTVSRITNNKYIHCDTLGTIPLKSLFCSPVHDTISQHTVLQKIAHIIGTETRADMVFNDDALRAELQKNGISVARRTIAKYRKKLNIPPSHIRKKGFKNLGK